MIDSGNPSLELDYQIRITYHESLLLTFVQYLLDWFSPLYSIIMQLCSHAKD